MQVFDMMFISDLHLHPENTLITERFFEFITWAKGRTRTLYILGDFFHAWAGDDTMDVWADSIAEKLAWLSEQGIKIYFMHGNRDFLLGAEFAKKAKVSFIKDSTIIRCGNDRVMLSHGDRFCTKDIMHQIFRTFTRNSGFLRLFLSLPIKLRKNLVSQVRQISKSKSYDAIKMNIVPNSMYNYMDKAKIKVLIHGHTHRPGFKEHRAREKSYEQYVLSDWDDRPQILCYDNTRGLSFVQY